MKIVRDLNIFTNEINSIQSDSIKKFVMYALYTLVPEYFWEVPASSTGNYHPESSNGQGGLVRHTKSVVKIATYLSQLEFFNSGESYSTDRVIAGALLHDTFKYGHQKSEYTTRLHPMIAAEAYRDHYREIAQFSGISEDDFNKIMKIIESHSGQWNYNPDTHEEELPKPETPEELVVHVADYLSSRRDIEVKQ